jgi:4-amino-4-deoxy-L-arabinose transferase-like glycosyltransferase
MLTPDMLMTFWITMSIACLVHGLVPRSGFERSNSGWMWGFFACQGLGFMTKGPMALVVPASAAVGWIWTARGPAASPVRIPWVRGMILALAIGFAWFVVLSLRVPGLLDYFVGDELVKRVASKSHGRSKPFWFFLPVLMGGALPWTVFFPALLRSAWTRFHHRRAHALLPWQGMLLGWTIIPFLVLSISGSKLLTYVLPLYPALALAVAVAWDRHASNPRQEVRLAWRAGALLLALLVAALLSLRFTRWAGNQPVWPLAVPLFLVVQLIRQRWKAESDDDLSRLAVAASTVWVALVLQAPAANPILGRQATVRELAAVAEKYVGPDGVLFSFDVRACGFGFYLQRTIGIRASEADLVLPPTIEESRHLIRSPADAVGLAAPGKPVCGLIAQEHWGVEFSEPEWKELGRAGAFVLVGRVAPTSPGAPP